MRRELWILMFAIVGWCLAAGFFFGNRSPHDAAVPLADVSPPATAPASPTPTPSTPPIPPAAASGPAPLTEWSPAKAQAGAIPDPSGNGFDATVHGSARVLPVWAGRQALSFDGTGDNGFWHGQPQNCGLSIDKPLRQAFKTLSVEAWVKKDRAGWMPILYRDRWDDENGFGLYAEWSQGKAVFGHYGDDSGVRSSTVVQDGQWHYLVGTMGPTGDGHFRYRIYVDGNPDGEHIGAWAVSESPPDGGILQIAYPNNSGAEQPFKGDLASIALFDIELSPDQIKSRYESQRPR